MGLKVYQFGYKFQGTNRYLAVFSDEHAALCVDKLLFGSTEKLETVVKVFE